MNDASELDGSLLAKQYRSSSNFTSGHDDGDGAAHIIAYLMFTIYGAIIGAGIMYFI